MLLITSVSAGVLITSIAASLVYDRYQFRQSLAGELFVLSESISPDLRVAIVFGYDVQAEETLRKLTAKPSIIAACIYTQGHVLFAQFSSGRANSACPQRPGSIGPRFTADYLDHFS